MGGRADNAAPEALPAPPTAAEAPVPAPAGGGATGGGSAVERRGLAAVGSTAVTKVLVMGLSGLLGVLTSRMIISNFGLAAYAQYGLLTTITALIPFHDLGVAAVVINAIAESPDPRSDDRVRRTLTTALRVLVGSGAVIALTGVGLLLLGAWPALLGKGLIPGDGERAAAGCLATFGLLLPFTVGQRILLGLQRSTTQVAAQAVVAPFMIAGVGTVVLLALPLGGYLSVISYVANAAMWIVCFTISTRLLSPQVRRAVRDVPRIRAVPAVPIRHTAWPMLAQMLALPVALQTDRLLLSHLRGSTELAQYNLASQLFGLVLQTVATAGIALWPMFARARAGSAIVSPARAAVAFLAVGLGLGGLLAALSPWVAGFVSKGQTSLDGWILGGFIAFVAAQAINYPLGMYMTDARGLRHQVGPILAMVPLNLALSWWLTLRVGAGGPILGSAISVLACQVATNARYVRKDLARRRAEAAAAAGSAVSTALSTPLGTLGPWTAFDGTPVTAPVTAAGTTTGPRPMARHVRRRQRLAWLARKAR